MAWDVVVWGGGSEVTVRSSPQIWGNDPADHARVMAWGMLSAAGVSAPDDMS